MLITFRCKAYANITMFGDVALQLIKMMGHSGAVPGALMPDDIPVALENLRASLAQVDMSTAPANSDENEPVVSISHRAMPLIELLEAAEKEEVPVMWDK